MNTSLPLASLLLALVLPLTAESAPATAPATITPARRDIHRWISVPATTRANQEVVLCARIAGYLTAITVDRGSSVTAGQAIATVEAPELGADLVRLRAELEVAKVDLARLTTARTKAPDLVMPRTIDEADGRLRIAAANLARTETLVSFGHIAAPFAGVVTQRWVDPGAFIAVPTAGGKTGALVTIADIATVRVIVPVPEQEAAFVKIGRPAQVRFDGLAEPLSTTVARHSHTVDAGSGTMTVELDLANPEQRLLPGMFARVRLATDLHVQALTLPAAAVLSENSGASVFKSLAGVAKKSPVKIGFNDGAFAEILSGVAEDEQVLMPVVGLVDGQTIPVATKP